MLLLLWRAIGAEEVAPKDVWSQSAGGSVMIDPATDPTPKLGSVAQTFYVAFQSS